MEARPERAPNRSDLALFLAVAFGGSWGLVGLLYLLHFRLGGWHTYAIGVPYMFFPALGAWLAERRRGARVLSSLEVRFRPNGWWLAASLGALAIALATVGMDLALPGIHPIHSLVEMIPKNVKMDPAKLAHAREKLRHFSPLLLVPLMIVQALVAGATINAVAAFGEELGWRGYLQRAFARFGFWKGSLLVGLVWGPWHWPLILQGYNYPQHPRLGLLLMTVETMLLAPLFAAVRLRGRSVLASSIAHGTFNAAAGFGLVFVTGGSDLTKGVTGVAGFAVLVVANAALFAWMRRHPLAPKDAARGAAPSPH